MHMTENEQYIFEEDLCFCFFCKDAIAPYEKLKKRKYKYYHDFCWRQLTDNYEELNFG